LQKKKKRFGVLYNRSSWEQYCYFSNNVKKDKGGENFIEYRIESGF
jgi:hypothetical protein